MSKHASDPLRPLKAATYAASSQLGENAAERQREDIEAMLKRLDYPCNVVKAYVDAGRSPSNRPALRELVDGIRTGSVAVDITLVACLDRLGRSKKDVVALCQELDRHYGVSVLSAETGFVAPLMDL